MLVSIFCSGTEAHQASSATTIQAHARALAVRRTMAARAAAATRIQALMRGVAVRNPTPDTADVHTVGAKLSATRRAASAPTSPSIASRDLPCPLGLGSAVDLDSLPLATEGLNLDASLAGGSSLRNWQSWLSPMLASMLASRAASMHPSPLPAARDRVPVLGRSPKIRRGWQSDPPPSSLRVRDGAPPLVASGWLSKRVLSKDSPRSIVHTPSSEATSSDAASSASTFRRDAAAEVNPKDHIRFRRPRGSVLGAIDGLQTKGAAPRPECARISE